MSGRLDYSNCTDAELIQCRAIQSKAMEKLRTRIAVLERELDSLNRANAMRREEFDAIVAERHRRGRP